MELIKYHSRSANVYVWLEWQATAKMTSAGVRLWSVLCSPWNAGDTKRRCILLERDVSHQQPLAYDRMRDQSLPVTVCSVLIYIRGDSEFSERVLNRGNMCGEWNTGVAI